MPVDSAELTNSPELNPVLWDDFDSSLETDDDASEGGDWGYCSYDLSHQSGTKAFSVRSNMSKEDFLDFHESWSPLAVIPQSPADESNNQGNISPKKKLQDFFRVLLPRGRF